MKKTTHKPGDLSFLTNAKADLPKERGVKRNVTAGSNYELDIRDKYRALGFPHVVSTRSENKTRDGQKIDLINTDEWKNGRFPYNVQCKNTCQHVEYHDIFVGYPKYVKPKRLEGEKIEKQILGMPLIPGIVNVIHHKLTSNLPILTETTNGTKVTNVEGKFLPLGNYVILREEDWFTIVAERVELLELKRAITSPLTEMLRSHKTS